MAKHEIQPSDDCVVIKRLEVDEKTLGGIVLPGSAKEKPQRGKVLAVGPGKLLDSGQRAPIRVNEGDEVLFTRYSGAEIRLDGDEIRILRESDILSPVLDEDVFKSAPLDSTTLEEELADRDSPGIDVEPMVCEELEGFVESIEGEKA